MARPPASTKARSTNTSRPSAAVTDWLALVDHDGAFLTPGVLLATFPDGFDRMDRDQRAELRSRAADVGDDSIERAALRTWMLRDLLEWGDELVDGQQIPATATATVAEHGVSLRPDAALVDTEDPNRVRLGLFTWRYGTDLDARAAKVDTGDDWRASPRERAERWCRESGVPLALVTDDERWLLVWAPRSAAAASGAFRVAELADERVLQDGLISLLGARRFFSVSDDPKAGETLERLFERSADTEVEVTKGLGRQVRRSVELLVSALSREHVASEQRLLESVRYDEVYEAAVTVMMRLVFLLFAEERRLLPAEDPLWADSYSVLDLRGELRAASLRDGEDALEKRATAWTRLLATFRAVHGGVNHDRLTLPAYGGALFDPERFPFLEGRHQGGSGVPPAIDDRTVLAILDALLTVQVRQGRSSVSQQVSYKALDVEQIGHCYEGLLDHGAAPVDVLSVGLDGPPAAEPELTVDELDAHRAEGDDALCEWLSDKERCGKSVSALQKLLAREPDIPELARLRAACDNDAEAVARILPYWGLLRLDLRGLPVVFPPGGLYVTQTSTRRNMGAQYTTKALAQEVVQYALEPLTYDPGPQNEVDPEKWAIRTPAQILELKVCDPAVGSGAILTAAGRYLADRLLDAIDEHGPGDGPLGERLADVVGASPEDRVTLARREVVDHCLYGVDKNPVAAEMAKLSLWLTTMARDRPFTFLDHAIQSGDSLLGITDIDQLRWLHLDPSARKGAGNFATLAIDSRINAAVAVAQELQSISVVNARDAEHKRQLHERLKAMLADLSVVADVVVGASLRTSAKGSRISYEDCIAEVSDRIRVALDDDYSEHERAAALEMLRETSERWLRTDLPDEGAPPWERRCLHWPLTSPEVFLAGSRQGFDALVGNPPFVGKKYWRQSFGAVWSPYVDRLLQEPATKLDLAGVFVRRAYPLLGHHGSAGLVLTSSLTEGESSSIAYGYWIDHGAIYRAVSTMPWPGDANVDVSLVWFTRRRTVAKKVLDGVTADRIGPALKNVRTVGPRQLYWPDLDCFIGSNNVAGESLTVEHGSDWFYTLKGSPYLRRYVSGEDITKTALSGVGRWIVDVGDRTLEELGSVSPETLRFLETVVWPARSTGILDRYKGLSDRWWQIWSHNSAAYHRLRQRSENCLVLPVVSKYVIAQVGPTENTYTNKVCIVHETRPDLLGLLNSSFFQAWAIEYSGSMGLRVSLSMAAAMQTYCTPERRLPSDLVGTWQAERERCLEGSGFTSMYNRVHDPEVSDADIVRLRELHVELDYAVRDAYGWSDLALDHHHWETPQGMRFTVSPAAKDELLDRLLELNHERYAEEVAAGLHDKKKAKGKAKPKATAENQGALDL